MELVPANVIHRYLVPYVCDHKLVMALFLSSRSMLEKGISMLGCPRLEYLDRVWWKLHKIRARLGTDCDPTLVDSSSEDDATADDEARGTKKKRRLEGLSGDEMPQAPQEPVARDKRSLPELDENSPRKRPCSVASQSAALHLPPPCPLGALTPDPHAPLTDRYPAGHSFWLKRMDVPIVCILIKWKSQEYDLVPLMKAREVIMYHKHPLRRVAILVGRCLTMLWREIIKVSGAKELFAMSDILPFV